MKEFSVEKLVGVNKNACTCLRTQPVVTHEEYIWRALLCEKRIDQLDIDISKEISEKRFLGLYLAKAFRAGHMFAQIEEVCYPAVGTLFVDEEGAPLSEKEAKILEQHIVEEFAKSEKSPFVADGKRVFFPYAKAVEVAIDKTIHKIAGTPPDLVVDKEVALGIIHDTAQSIHEEQKKAIEKLLPASCGFLTGGPGTGKTFTAGMWLKAIVKASRVPAHIALCAPTGRAAQTLGASITKTLGQGIRFDVQTIHRLLLSPFTFLPYNILVVDECSMIDASLFSRLLKKIHPGTRLLFLGDPDQLPPIDPGQPFRSLLEHLPQEACHAALTQSHRTESREILDLARSFLEGNALPAQGSNGAVSRIDLTGSLGGTQLEALLEKYSIHPWEQISSSEEASHILKETIVLSPTRVGSLGTERINEFVRLKRKRGRYTPVVFLKNDHELNVMNGDLGVVEEKEPLNYIHILGEQTLPAAVCPRHEEAFAISVHKSQGSEFNRVILIIPPGMECPPSLLYTAATRARQELIIVG